MRKTFNTALEELADVINNLPCDEPVAEQTDKRTQKQNLKQSSFKGITDRDILNALVEKYKDEPEIVRRLQSDYVKNGGKLTLPAEE